jgi:phosphoglycolate phosphatase
MFIVTRPSTTIVFDWNGTLLADTHCCWRSTNTVLNHLGRKTVTLEQYRAHSVVPIASMYQAFGCDAEELTQRAAEIHTIWNNVYDAQARSARLRRGARSVLQSLKNLPCSAVILSNHTVANISVHARRLGVYGHFNSILANERVGGAFTRKAKGERLPPYLRGNGVTHGIIVGDSEEEVEIARQHDMVSVALSGGVCSLRRLKAAKPDFVIQTLNELPAIVQYVFDASARRKV